MRYKNKNNDRIEMYNHCNNFNTVYTSKKLLHLTITSNTNTLPEKLHYFKSKT